MNNTEKKLSNILTNIVSIITILSFLLPHIAKINYISRFEASKLLEYVKTAYTLSYHEIQNIDMSKYDYMKEPELVDEKLYKHFIICANKNLSKKMAGQLAMYTLDEKNTNLLDIEIKDFSVDKNTINVNKIIAKLYDKTTGEEYEVTIPPIIYKVRKSIVDGFLIVGKSDSF